MIDTERELRRLQLLDELRGRLVAIERTPELDPTGVRQLELLALIEHLEEEELALAELQG